MTGPDTEIALMSLADAKEFVGSTDTTDWDSIISGYINAASARFEAETGRSLKSRSWTEYYDGNGTSELYLNNWPLSSTSITITIDADRAFTSTDDQVTSTDVMLDTELGRVWLDNKTFDSGTQNVKVEYTAGYSTDSEHALVEAAKDYVRLMWSRRVNGGGPAYGIRTESYEGVSRTYETDLPWSVKKVLDMYRGHHAI